MTRITLIVALALVVSGAATAGSQNARKPGKPVTHTVTIDGSSFQPARLTIARGDVVVWVNKDVVAHTATSTAAGAFDSDTMPPNAMWRHAFRARGAFPYGCDFHPTMKGTIVVE